MKLLIGLLVAVCVGVGCRWFGIPLPGPPAIMGAAMAVAMASGYTATDYWLTRKAPVNNTAAIQAPKVQVAVGPDESVISTSGHADAN